MTGSTRRAFLHALGAAPLAASGVGNRNTKENNLTVEAVVLGSAQDGGVPHAGCTKDLCSAARGNLALRRRSPCLAVLDHTQKKSFIFDAGPDFDEKLAMLPSEWKKGRNPFDSLFLTHAHIGHYTGLQFLGRAVMSTDKLPVYGSRRMMQFIRENGPWSLLVDLENVTLNPVGAGDVVECSPLVHVQPFSVPHRAEFTDTYAYTITGPTSSLLFLPDIDRWQEMDPPITEVIKGVSTALIDGTFYSPDELPGRDMSKIPHPRITESMDLLQPFADQGKDIVFFHLNHSNLALRPGSKEEASVLKRGFRIAHDGMRFLL